MAANNETQEFTKVTEGKATILFPKDEVFYNPAQIFNRDLSVAVIRTWSESIALEPTKRQLRKAAWEQKKKRRKEAQPTADETEPTDKESSNVNATEETNGNKPYQPKFTILEALSATGLRAIRYALEIPHVTTVLANDMSPDAITAIHRNISQNAVPSTLIHATCSDANALMYSRITHRVDVVDLDPYGTAAPFLDAAIQAIAGDGLLCVTCTDMSVLAGIGYPEKCFANYGGSPVKQEYTHEVALRLVLNSIAVTAGKYGRAIEPLLCLSIDFYVRLFVRVKRSPTQVKHLASNTMITYTCEGCGSWTNQQMGRITEKGNNLKFQLVPGPPTDSNCLHCGGRQFIAGPMWAGPIHNNEFVKNVQQTVEGLDESVYITRPRMMGMLTLAAEELDTPFYRTPQELASIIKTQTPPLDMVWSGLINSGYKVSSTHCKAGAIKTNAPTSIVWDLMKAWTKLHPVKQEKIDASPDAPFARILSKSSATEVDLTLRPDVDPNRTRITRFVEVPANWGPGTKAGKKEGRSWRGNKKRKREDGDEGTEMPIDAN